MNADKEKEIYWRLKILEEDLEFLRDFAEQKNFAKCSPHKALKYILDDYRQLRMQRFDLRFVANELKSDLLAELRNVIKKEVSSEIERIRLGTNNTDRNTQILIELLQGYIVSSNKKVLTTTEEYMPEFLVEMQELVQKRIEEQMIKKRTSQQI